MREALLALIAAAVQEAADGKLGTHVAVSLGGFQYPVLWFGAGYHDHRAVVMWTAEGEYEQVAPECAVDTLLAVMKTGRSDEHAT